MSVHNEGGFIFSLQTHEFSLTETLIQMFKRILQDLRGDVSNLFEKRN